MFWELIFLMIIICWFIAYGILDEKNPERSTVWKVLTTAFMGIFIVLPSIGRIIGKKL